MVDPGVTIGEGTKIWHFSHVMSGAQVGKACAIGQNVFIGRDVVIGNNVRIQNNVSVYEGVTLEDDVFCGPSMVFTNVDRPRSAHLRGREGFLKTLVKRGCTIGANATVVCGHTLGAHSFIGAGSVVTSDVPDYGLIYGVPARLQGWVCECGTKLTFKHEKAECECGRGYEQIDDNEVVRID
jgi:UDP-2-acetamido-3-amino-2,3-dideoxy-glucuronate N-acetyltransferase